MKHRAMYQALKSRVFPDIAASSSDPLNSGGGSTWELYYRNIELMNEIKTDLQRLYPNNCDDYFMQPRRQEALANVLLVWARQHEHVAYRQGMHELLAPLLLAVEADCRNLRTVAERHPHVLNQHGVISLILDEAQLEADCYWMFDVIMREISSVFVARPDAQLSDPYRPDVRELCDRIQQELLRKVDPQLADHLQNEGVSSHLYGIKWVRLMFAREFSLQDMLVLWDFLFAGFFEGRSLLDMVEVVSVAMIHLLRDRLMQSDVHECLSQLMRYPGVSKIEELLTLSAVIQSDPDSLPRRYEKRDNKSADRSCIDLPHLAFLWMLGCSFAPRDFAVRRRRRTARPRLRLLRQRPTSRPGCSRRTAASRHKPERALRHTTPLPLPPPRTLVRSNLAAR